MPRPIYSEGNLQRSTDISIAIIIWGNALLWKTKLIAKQFDVKQLGENASEQKRQQGLTIIVGKRLSENKEYQKALDAAYK